MDAMYNKLTTDLQIITGMCNDSLQHGHASAALDTWESWAPKKQMGYWEWSTPGCVG